MNNQPLVSIIMPSYNSGEFIEDSIKSVLDQTYLNWELIIIDDCSTDNTKSIIKSINNNKIKFIENKINSGAAKTRNKGITSAQGRFIAFLDSDDLWHPKKLEKQIAFMLKNNFKLTYTNYTQIKKLGDPIKTFECPKEATYKQLLKTCYIGCLTVIYDSELLGKVLMPEIRKRQDYALWLKILKNNTTAYCLEENLASYRVHENSISHNKLAAAKYNWILYRNIEQLGLLKSCYYFSYYALNGIKRKIFK